MTPTASFWLAYASIALAVGMLVLKEAAREGALGSGTRALVRSRHWLGTALILTLLSGAALAGALIVQGVEPGPRAPAVVAATPAQRQPTPLPPNVGTPHQPAVPGLPDVTLARLDGPLPIDLRALTVPELKAVAYTLSARLGDLVGDYLVAVSASRDLTPADATNRRAQLDAGLNRTFHTQFEEDVFRAGRELQRRHGIASEVLEVTNTVVTWGDVTDVQYRVAQSASLLP